MLDWTMSARERGARVKTGTRAAVSDAQRLPTTDPRRAERRARGRRRDVGGEHLAIRSRGGMQPEAFRGSVKKDEEGSRGATALGERVRGMHEIREVG